jgi:TM2 domain-containing membrane protein YozV
MLANGTGENGHQATSRRTSRFASCLVAAGLALTLAFAPSAQAQTDRPPTGIPSLDSLPLHDWGVPDHPLSMPLAIGLATAFPGGGQFYGGHPVRGSFLLGMEALLAGLALNTYYVDLPRRGREIRDNLDSADAAAARWAQSGSSADRQDFETWTLEARRNARLRLQYADLANSQLAWAAGLHFYGIADAIEIARRSHEPIPPERSARRALLYGLVFPGGAQLYNGRYGKFGMLWMALGASAVSANSRQNVVESLNASLAVARTERDLGYATDIDEMERDRTLYRRRRNQYYWGSALLYVYAILDGMVDAAMSDFDRPNRYALMPGPLPMSFVAEVRF